MKKILLAMSALLAASTASAYELEYLKFMYADGREQAIKVDELVITPSDGKLIAANATETLILEPADLTKMFFTNTNSIDDIAADAVHAPVQVYTLTGGMLKSYPCIETAKDDLAPGIYIVRQAGKAEKLIVK